MTASDYNKQFEQTVAGSKPSFVAFLSDSCPRCGDMRPVLENAAADLGDSAHFIYVDTALHQDLMKKYKVDSHPYYILFKDGQEVWRDGGRKPFHEIVDMVRRFI